MRLIISPTAVQDLKRLSDYFLAHNVEFGEQLFQEFNRKCQNLTKFPKMGRAYPNIAPSLRGVPLDGYIIFYRATETELEIVRVVSGRQNLEDVFADND